MGYIRRHRVFTPVSTSGGASHAFFTSGHVQGFIEAIGIRKASASAVSSNARYTITAELSSQVILAVTATGTTASLVFYYPRAQAQNVSGLALLGVSTADASGIWPVQIPVAQERVKIDITSGGAASGVFTTNNYVDLYISGG